MSHDVTCPECGASYDQSDSARHECDPDPLKALRETVAEQAEKISELEVVLVASLISPSPATEETIRAFVTKRLGRVRP
jgi:hypothetical protein